MRNGMDIMNKCKKCGHSLPCPEHTVMIDEKTGSILFPKEGLDEGTKRKVREIRDALKDI